MTKGKKVQQALVLIKPDGLKKSLTGNILTKLSEARLEIIGAKVVKVTRELALNSCPSCCNYAAFQYFFKDFS